MWNIDPTSIENPGAGQKPDHAFFESRTADDGSIELVLGVVGSADDSHASKVGARIMRNEIKATTDFSTNDCLRAMHRGVRDGYRGIDTWRAHHGEEGRKAAAALMRLVLPADGSGAFCEAIAAGNAVARLYDHDKGKLFSLAGWRIQPSMRQPDRTDYLGGTVNTSPRHYDIGTAATLLVATDGFADKLSDKKLSPILSSRLILATQTAQKIKQHQTQGEAAALVVVRASWMP